MKMTAAYGFINTENNRIIRNSIDFYMESIFQVQPGISRSTMYLWNTSQGIGILYAGAILV
ncbi:hypothetical protein ES708_34039 [subsurface metagenome]